MAARDAPTNASTNALVELIAEVMDASFEQLGEGILMASMPEYLRDFGARNARYLSKRYVTCSPEVSAVDALAPLNMVSEVTGSQYDMPVATRNHAVKRLRDCEFMAAFQDRSPHTRALVCTLHAAVYEGSVNGLIEDPETDGYRLDLRSRMLFGDPHCDFHVTSLTDKKEGESHPDLAATVPELSDQSDASYHFYAAIITAFASYLHTVMSADEARDLMRACGERVGATLAAEQHEDQAALMKRILEGSGRQIEDGCVTACQYVRPIVGGTKDSPHRDEIRAACCTMCAGVLAGATQSNVTWRSTLAGGATKCQMADSEL